MKIEYSKSFNAFVALFKLKPGTYYYKFKIGEEERIDTEKEHDKIDSNPK